MEKPHKQVTIVLGIIERNGKFLILRRVDDVAMWDKKWELPGGKIEPNESTEDALLREIQEETGLPIKNIRILAVDTYHWDHPEFIQQTFILLYRAETDQEQVIMDPAENDTYRWVTIDEFFSIDQTEQLGGFRQMIERLYAPVVRSS